MALILTRIYSIRALPVLTSLRSDLAFKRRASAGNSDAVPEVGILLPESTEKAMKDTETQG